MCKTIFKIWECKVGGCGNLTNYYQPNSFDLVTALHILEHMASPLQMLMELNKVTRKYILLAVPNGRCIVSEERKTHLYSWNSYTLTNIMEKADFSVRRISEDRINIFPHWLRLGPIINRILLKIITSPNELIALGVKIQ